MKLGDLGKSLGQIITAIGSQALGQFQASLTKAMASELGSMDLRRRRAVADRLRKELASPDHAMPEAIAKRLSGLVTDAAVEGRPKPFVAALEAAFEEAAWPSTQRVAFLQKVMPDAPLALKGVTVKGLSFSTGASPSTGVAAESPPSPVGEAPVALASDVAAPADIPTPAAPRDPES